MKFSVFKKMVSDESKEKIIFGKKEIEDLKKNASFFAKVGNLKMLKYLIDNFGINLDSTVKERFTWWHPTLQREMFSDIEKEISLFQIALENGHIDVAKMMVEKKKYTPSDLTLHEAMEHSIKQGHLDSVVFLLENFNTKFNRESMTIPAGHRLEKTFNFARDAHYSSSKKIYEVLLERGFARYENPYYEDKPLLTKLENSDNKKVREILDSEGAVKKLCDENPNHFIYHLAKIGKLEYLEYAKKYVKSDQFQSKINVEAGDDNVWNKRKKMYEDGLNISNPLQIALEYGHVEVAKFLIENGANLNHIKDDPISFNIFISELDGGNIESILLCLDEGLIKKEQLPEEYKDCFGGEEFDLRKAWLKHGGMNFLWRALSGEDAVDDLEFESPVNFNKKLYEEVLPVIKAMTYFQSGNYDKAAIISYKLAVLFDDIKEVEKFIDVYSNRGENHSLITMMERIKLPEKSDWKSEKWKEKILKEGLKWTKFLSLAGGIEERLGGVPFNFEAYQKAAIDVSYKRADEDREFAAVCLEMGVKEEVFDKILSIPQKKSDKLPDIEIDGANIDHPGYSLRKLKPGDRKAGILGYYTGCCQSIGSEGEQFAKFLMESENAGAYVIVETNKKGEELMVAQCMAGISESGRILLLDSWERKRPELDNIRDDFLTRLSTLATKEHGVIATHLGKGQHTQNHPSFEVATPVKINGFTGDNYDSREQYRLPVDERYLSEKLVR